jgi:hypothetical protein
VKSFISLSKGEMGDQTMSIPNMRGVDFGDCGPPFEPAIACVCFQRDLHVLVASPFEEEAC